MDARTSNQQIMISLQRLNRRAVDFPRRKDLPSHPTV